MIKNLKLMPYANARVYEDADGNKKLVSYRTVVLTLSADGWLTVNGLYSATTRRHISAFMREYTNFTYYAAKECVTEGYRANLLTGEIQSVN